jgi:membrane dipeptidase
VHTDLPRMKAGGITGEFFSIYVPAELAQNPTAIGGGPLRRAIDLVDVTYRQIERYPNDLMLATSTADIRRAKREGKVAVLMGVEGGHAIENSLAALRVLHRLGCRYMTLTHTNTNEWAASAGSLSAPPVVRHHGLSPFGEEVVREMQRIGMLVDVSHVADETFWAVIKVAKAPIIASHSSSRAVADNKRNLSDDMLRAIAKNGGVAMVNFWSMFLSTRYSVAAARWSEKNAKALAEIRAKHKDDPIAQGEAFEALKAQADLPKVPLSVLVDHIDHMVKVAGIDHVGLGSDFDGVDELPEGISGIDALPKITLMLVERGYKDEDILKVLGENFLRAFAEAEGYARDTKTTLSGDGNARRIAPTPTR